MATYNAFDSWIENMAEVANCGTDQFVVALCAAANAPVSSNTVLANLTQIDYTNCSSRNLTTSGSSQSSGTYSLAFSDLTISASGGAIATFRYIVIYDDTPSSPADPLVCWYDYGSNLTLANGESLLIDFGAALFSGSFS